VAALAYLLLAIVVEFTAIEVETGVEVTAADLQVALRRAIITTRNSII